MAEWMPEISGRAVVLVGSFNPKIFQPEWFSRQGLMSQSEADAAEIKIIHQQVCQFETEQFALLVTTDRFQVMSQKNVSAMPLQDLVQGTFFILEHTPVTAMGLNSMAHFSMQSEEHWHRVGDKLAPKDLWKDVSDERVGLISMTTEIRKPKPVGALTRFKIEPSSAIKWGIFFEVNEHYPGEESGSVLSLLQILSERWEESQNYASTVINNVLDRAITES